MGREVRRVPADWVHPQDDRGRLYPLHEGGFAEAEKEWNEGYALWLTGFVNSYTDGGIVPIDVTEHGHRWSDWHGSRPSPDDYMPDWPEEQRTHYMMYEDTSEGTPISPAFATPEELARWLADNGASSFGSSTATYEQWLRVCNGGFAPSMVLDGNGLRSGVEALSDPR